MVHSMKVTLSYLAIRAALSVGTAWSLYGYMQRKSTYTTAQKRKRSASEESEDNRRRSTVEDGEDNDDDEDDKDAGNDVALVKDWELRFGKPLKRVRFSESTMSSPSSSSSSPSSVMLPLPFRRFCSSIRFSSPYRSRTRMPNKPRKLYVNVADDPTMHQWPSFSPSSHLTLPVADEEVKKAIERDAVLDWQSPDQRPIRPIVDHRASKPNNTPHVHPMPRLLRAVDEYCARVDPYLWNVPIPSILSAIQSAPEDKSMVLMVNGEATEEGGLE